MEASSIHELCRCFMYLAIQRCRLLDDLCRLSVFLKSSPLSHPPFVRISISDTGVGSCLEEFLDIKITRGPILDETWDGVISVATTNICDDKIYHQNLNLKGEASMQRLTKLPSASKNGAKFSGTEISLSTLETVDNLMQILMIPKLAIEFVIDRGDPSGSRCENIIQAIQCVSLSSDSNIEYLKSGLEDYVLKHNNHLQNICHSCFPNREHLKVGTGVACYSESSRNAGQVMEAVIVISQLSESTSPSCFQVCDGKTEVLYYKDFSPCLISRPSLNALTSIDWKSYGLTLRSNSDENSTALLEWENLPLGFHIDIVLHHYQKKYPSAIVMPPAKQMDTTDRSLTRKAVKFALNDLKEKNAGVLLTAQTLKIRSYAPDLARTLAGLILSSNDSNFQGECLSLLGLQSQEIESETVEDCIKERLISVIDLNDRKPQRNKEAAPYLFDDGCYEVDNFPDDYEEGEEANSSLEI
ncbi:type 2 DNA topoisomerase 6 subunit B-like [Heracleum sosnowskyi]|uniref:Type 2 DNA topoisomerase 6 subunit B-like n=1 Tax=Heracleum sosnowskyi TaxID=360622 RepID=A0AAD8MLL4_9APIA|nr:type 2 DNA topoisomerase 6 subunit B-like [Heracleum sosnowskyi]